MNWYFVAAAVAALSGLWGVYQDNTSDGHTRRRIEACEKAAKAGILPSECGTAIASTKQKPSIVKIEVPPPYPRLNQ